MTLRQAFAMASAHLGYCDTTGMDAMDYRLTDAYADPPGTTERFHAERLIRLPDVFACFRSATDSPPVQPPPAMTRGMGVPVVSLAGKTAAGRAGLGILSAAGLPGLATCSAAEFVRAAAALAGDVPGLRQQMESSPRMDAPRFARNMEAAYRAMWRTWCAGQPPQQT